MRSRLAWFWACSIWGCKVDDWCVVMFCDGGRLLVLSGRHDQLPRRNPFPGQRPWAWLSLGRVPDPVWAECNYRSGPPMGLPSLRTLKALARGPERLLQFARACALFDDGKLNEAEEEAFKALANGAKLYPRALKL